MKQLVYCALVPMVEMVTLVDIELLAKIACQTVIAGCAILTYFHRAKNKSNKNDEP